MTDLVQRIAAQYLSAAGDDDDQKIKELISSRVFMLLKRTYTPRNLRFFTLYQDLYAVEKGARREIPKNLHRFVMILARRVYKMMPTKQEAADFGVKIDDLMVLLKRYDEDRSQRQLVRQIARAYAEAIGVLAESAGAPLKRKRVDSTGFFTFRKMTGRQQKLLDLSRTDPEMYEQLQKNEEIVKRVRRRTKELMKAEGLIPAQKRVRGRFVLTGKDPVSGEETVFTDDGDSMPLDTFLDREDRRQEAIKRLSRFEKVRGRGEAVKPEDVGLTRDELNAVREKLARTHTRVFLNDLDELRAMSDEELEVFTEGPVETIALTDDKKKRHAMTRIYEVKRTIDGRKVVVNGRFKGYYVDELVNASGRLIEGTAYDYNPQKGQTFPVPLERRGKDGSVELRIQAAREPYITVDENGDLMMMLPRTHEWSEIRNDVDRLELVSETFRPIKSAPVIGPDGQRKMVSTRKALYKFKPEDFGMVRDLVGGCALSQAAVEKVDAYYRTLSEQQATESERVTKLYSTDHIGGFSPQIEFRRVQKEAMAWCEARDWSGVIAMGTGTGKTAATIGIIQKMIKDGKADEGSGKFLYVCPAKLVGNLPKEIAFFCKNPEEVLERVDVVSYDEYLIRYKKNPTFADDYVRIFFDEAQKRLMRKNDTSIAVSKAKAKKIIMTASPMEKYPQDAYMLAAIANGENLFEENPRGDEETEVYVHEYSEKKRKWKRRFTQAVGGRIMGLKNDPATKRAFHEWAKKNIFVKRAQDLPEIFMPELRRQTEAVTMPPEVEEEYRKEVAKVEDVMVSMVRKYRDLEKKGLHDQVDSYQAQTGELGEIYKKLKILADRPGDIIPGAGYPKIDRAVEIIDEKIEEGRRTILFTDSPDMARLSVKQMSERFPGRRHAVGLADGIEVWMDGSQEAVYGRKAYVDNNGNPQPEEDWAVVVLKNFVSQDPGVLTLTLTSAYSTGQNLQSFDCVVHLDRDSWNSEEMKQRTARSWRTGQKNTVDEYTMDAVYSGVQSEMDATLDEIRRHVQEIDEKLFDDMIVESQQVALGADYTGIKKYDAEVISLNRRYMDQAMSPRAQSLGEVAYTDHVK